MFWVTIEADALGVISAARERRGRLAHGERLVVLLELMRRPTGVLATEAQRELDIEQWQLARDVRSLRGLVDIEVDSVRGVRRYTAVPKSSDTRSPGRPGGRSGRE